MDGWDFTDQDYGEEVYVSDTVGRLADAASATNIIQVGFVIPAHGQPLGTAADKVLYVDVQAAVAAS